MMPSKVVRAQVVFAVWREDGASGNRPASGYRPVQTGFRLSRKAAGPSCASAL
jgi:hypothetical protein